MSCVYGSGKPATNVRILWITVWKARKLEMQCHCILRAIREGSRNTFTVGKRASSGVTRDVGGAGKPVPSADAWHWRAVRSARETPGNWPSLARRDQAGSPPSHTWRGPCLIQRDTADSTRTETPARTRIPVATAICRTPRRIIRRRRRTPQCGLRAGRASGGGTLPDGFPSPAFAAPAFAAGVRTAPALTIFNFWGPHAEPLLGAVGLEPLYLGEPQLRREAHRADVGGLGKERHRLAGKHAGEPAECRCARLGGVPESPRPGRNR
jgi:hypothetical protein